MCLKKILILGHTIQQRSISKETVKSLKNSNTTLIVKLIAVHCSMSNNNCLYL